MHNVILQLHRLSRFYFFLILLCQCVLFYHGWKEYLSVLLQNCDLSLHRGLFLTEKAVLIVLRFGEVHTGSWTGVVLSGKEIGSMGDCPFLACFGEISALSHFRNILSPSMDVLNVFWLIRFNELIKTFVFIVPSFHFVILIKVENPCRFIQISRLTIYRACDFFDLGLEVELTSCCSEIL